MIWPLYTALLALLFVFLSIRTLNLRRKLRIVIGDGGNPVMLRAMRTHANFAEYVPLGILLIVGSEQLDAPAALLHALGLLLLVGRLLHAFGVSSESEVLAYRVTGMAMTLTCYLVAAFFILWRVLG